MVFQLLIPSIFLVFMHSISEAKRLDLSTYEYIRKFQTPLALGSCPSRVVRHDSGKVVLETCSFSAGNQGQASYEREEYTRQMSLVANVSQLLDIIGLCDGTAVSYIGILNDGDCVATEISKLVTFSKKHVTHGYREFYQTKVDTLAKGRGEGRHEDFSHYTNDIFYLNHIGHGGLEIILVQTQFSDRRQAESAASFHMDAFLPSKNLEIIAKVAGIPKKIMVIMLSTLSTSLIEIRKYKGSEGLTQALKLIKELEGRMRWNVRGASRHKEQTTKPISYGFLPFIETSKAPVELEEKSAWKTVCLLEIEADKIYGTGKKLLKPCKSIEKRKNLPTGLRRPSCTNITRLMKDAKLERLLLHDKRSLWYWLTAEEKMQLTSVFSEKMSSIRTQIDVEAKQIKKIKKAIAVGTEI